MPPDDDDDDDDANKEKTTTGCLIASSTSDYDVEDVEIQSGDKRVAIFTWLMVEC